VKERADLDKISPEELKEIAIEDITEIIRKYKGTTKLEGAIKEDDLVDIAVSNLALLSWLIMNQIQELSENEIVTIISELLMMMIHEFMATKELAYLDKSLGDLGELFTSDIVGQS